MKKSLFYATLLVAPLFMACSNDDGPIGRDADQVEIKLGTQIARESLTRSAQDATQETYIAANELVYAFADYAADNTAYFGAWQLTADAGGNLVPGVNNVKYYPKGNKSINLYAIHGNQLVINPGQSFPASITHNVLEDQKTADNYVKSDLLYGILRNQNFSTETVNMNFYHMLSKIEIALKPGPGVFDADLVDAEVQLMNVRPTVTFSPVKHTLAELDVPETRGNMVVVGGNRTNITFTPKFVDRSTEGFGNPTYAEVIIPPQNINDMVFLKLTFKSGGLAGKELTYKLTKTFTSGNCYRFHILITPTIINLASEITVTPWSADDSADVDSDGNRVIDFLEPAE